MSLTSRLLPSVVFALSSFVCAAGPVAADAVSDFFTGKTIRVVSAGGAGGAHGVYAHLLSGHIRKHIPGNPTVVMQFMPGAGGNKAMNFLFNATQDDGTWLGVPLQDLIFNARIGAKAVLAKRNLSLRPIAWQAQQALAKTILATPEKTVKRLKTILKLK